MLKRGADLIGCDLSPRMMALLRRKYPTARLALADASQLPFPAGHFDALTTCHVMHLVGPWREALREFRRVLRRGGKYINAQNDGSASNSIRQQVRDFWQSLVAAHGFSRQRPGVQNEKELHAELRSMGAEVKRVEAVRYSRAHTVREVIDGLAQRTNSHTWDIPDDTFESCMCELREWAAAKFDDWDRIHEEEASFVLDIAHFN